MTPRSDELVITGLGMATASAYGLEAHWDLLRQGAVKASADDYSMRAFKPAAHLKEPRLLKAVSPTDGIGLAALGGLQRSAAPAPEVYQPTRCGLYTGSPGPSSQDLHPYFEAMEAARDASGHIDVGTFGRTARGARPTTLLASLANNVLCYGSMMFNAQGPNSNYISGALSGHIAVQNAAKRLRRGQLDYAVAGAFGAHTDPVDQGMYRRLGLLLAPKGQGPYTVMPYDDTADAVDGTVLADGAAFVSIERRGAALARGATVLATYAGGALASDGLGPLQVDAEGAQFSRVIQQALAEAGVQPAAVGLILANASGHASLDRRELAALHRVFAGVDRPEARPALAITTRVFGNLMEAGGLLELALVSLLFSRGELPPVMAAPDSTGFSNRIPTAQGEATYALVLKANPWGEYSCIVLRRESI